MKPTLAAEPSLSLLCGNGRDDNEKLGVVAGLGRPRSFLLLYLVRLHLGEYSYLYVACVYGMFGNKPKFDS